VGGDELAGHDHLGLAEVRLSILTGPKGEGDHSSLGTSPCRNGAMLAHVAADSALRPRELVFLLQPLPDAMGRMALLLRTLLVLAQPLLDDGDEWSNYW